MRHMKAISRSTTLPAQAGNINGVFQLILDLVNVLTVVLGLFASFDAISKDESSSR